MRRMRAGEDGSRVPPLWQAVVSRPRLRAGRRCPARSRRDGFRSRRALQGMPATPPPEGEHDGAASPGMIQAELSPRELVVGQETELTIRLVNSGPGTCSNLVFKLVMPNE